MEKDGTLNKRLQMEDAIRYYTRVQLMRNFMENWERDDQTRIPADIVITDKDLLTITENEIMKTRVDYTITGGKSCPRLPQK